MAATDFIDTKKLADQLETLIVDRFEHNFFRVSGADRDVSMQSLYISDAGDMLEVVHLIRQSEFEAARKHLFHMDTSPREELYYYLELTAGSEIADSIL